MATNSNKNSIIRAITSTRDTEPASSALTGTISIPLNSTVATGVGTLFTTELKVGDWLYVSADNEIRQIIVIESATVLRIADAFSAAYVAATFRKTAMSNRKEISWLVVAGATALIDGQSVPINSYGGWSTSGRATTENPRDFVDPIIFDTATVAGSVVLTIKKG